MRLSAIIIELEPLAPSLSEAAPYLSVSERSLSRLISEGGIEARKRGTRTLVDVASPEAALPKKTDHALIVFGRRARALPRTLAQSRH